MTSGIIERQPFVQIPWRQSATVVPGSGSFQSPMRPLAVPLNFTLDGVPRRIRVRGLP